MTDQTMTFIVFKALNADKRNNRQTARVKRVGTLTRVVSIASLLIILVSSVMMIVSWVELNSSSYKYNLEKYEEYNNLYDKYTTVDLAICMRRNEAVQEDKHTKARIHELHVKDEESGRKQWSDFDALLAYYGRSDVNYEQLQQLIEENNAERSAYGNLVRGIESKAGETREMGFDFMCLGSALAVIGLIRILRDLQLLGRFSQKPKYSIC